jgi:multiple sugar transport system substrate-binding protein
VDNLHGLSRRKFLGVGAAVAGLVVANKPAARLAGAASSTRGLSDSTKAIRLDFAWWGDTVLNSQTFAVLRQYHKLHPSVTINGIAASYSAYYDKLLTEIAGGDAPDIQQQNPPEVTTMTSKGDLADLTPYNKIINYDTIPASILEPLHVDGKLVGIPMTTLANAVFYEPDRFKSAGVSAPTNSWSWDDFVKLLTAVKAKGGKNFYGADDPSGTSFVFQVWLRERGKDLWNTSGGLAHNADDVAAWFTYWQTQRKNGIIVPPDMQDPFGFNNSGNTPDDPFVKGQSAISWRYAGDITGWQPLVKTTIEEAVFPDAVNKKGEWLGAGDLLTMYSKTKYPTEVAGFIGYVINNRYPVEEFTGRFPANPTMERLLEAKHNPETAKMVGIINVVGKYSKKAPPLAPPGNGEVGTAFQNAAEKVAYGKMTPKAAADEYIAQAKSALAAG